GAGGLFDSLVGFEKYPIDRRSLSGGGGGLRLGGGNGDDATPYPLGPMGGPRERLGLRGGSSTPPFQRAGGGVLWGRGGWGGGAGGSCAGGCGRGARCCDRSAGHSVGGGAPYDPARVERDGACAAGGDAAAAVCGAGGRDA